MFDYLNGLITKIDSSYIVLDVNGVGFKVFMPNPYVFEEGNTSKVFLYNHVREDEYTLYGFKSEEERELFLKLLDVKGVGPKMALPILATGSVSGIKDAINRENIMYLKKFPKIGEKVARQIILDLKGKVNVDQNIVNTEDELYEVLVSLGYKASDINSVIKQVNKEASIEMQVKEALKLLLR